MKSPVGFLVHNAALPHPSAVRLCLTRQLRLTRTVAPPLSSAVRLRLTEGATFTPRLRRRLLQ